MTLRTTFGLALLACSGLLLEIELTRLFASIYYPPYVYALLALAVLGIGIGAAVATVVEPLRRASHMPLYAAAASLATVAVTVVVLFWPDPALQALHLTLATLPFVVIGLILATIFSLETAASPQLYAADLTGAGLGALLAVPLIDALSLPAALLTTAVLFSITAVLWGGERTAIVWGALALALLLLGGTIGRNWITLDLTRLAGDKPLVARISAGATLVDTVWDAFARTDLIDPGNGQPYELYMDGAAGSIMPPHHGDAALWADIGFFPFATEQPARVFVIGPGGGLDIWFGLQSGASQIDAIEVNRASVTLTKRQGDYNGALYDRPEVRVQVDEGRSALARKKTSYDLIFLSHVVTLAAERGGLALIENSAFTVEAFAEYFAQLAPGGMVALKLYDEPTLARALSTALAVLTEQGMSDAAALQHVISLVDTQVDPPIPLLMIRSTPFSQDDALSIGAVAREVGFTPLYLPHVLAAPPLDAVAAGEMSFASVIATSDTVLTPVTDNRPFFYHFQRGLPPVLINLLVGLLILVVIGGVAVALLVRRIALDQWLRRSPLYFALLGAGFMLVEVALLQQTQILIGHPSVSLAAVLGVVLIGGGLGSILFGRVRTGQILQPNQIALVGIVVAVISWSLIWPTLQQVALGWELTWRLLLVSWAILPLALCMGAPFPIGLRAVGGYDARLVALAWAVNGVFSVAGATIGLALAMTFGYQTVLMAGGAAYGAALLVGRLPRRT